MKFPNICRFLGVIYLFSDCSGSKTFNHIVSHKSEIFIRVQIKFLKHEKLIVFGDFGIAKYPFLMNVLNHRIKEDKDLCFLLEMSTGTT